jgi:hypothetical protein
VFQSAWSLSNGTERLNGLEDFAADSLPGFLLNG